MNPSNWKISLPIFPPSAVLDNSTISEYSRCPRRGFYRYGLRRGFEGKSYTIQYGIAYHRYRETLEKEMIVNKSKLTEEIHQVALKAALHKYEEPPVGHRYEYLSRIRLIQACEKSKERVREEQRTGKIIVTRAEDSFDLELPFFYCENCGWTIPESEAYTDSDDSDDDDAVARMRLKHCPTCDGVELTRARHGGRVDQFVLWSAFSKDMIRDFKTTSRMGKDYDLKFDPNSQMTGYVWAGSELSGRKFDGVLIETIYNTKSAGPDIFQTYVQFSAGQIEQWQASMMMERQFIQTCFARAEELGYLAFPMRTAACPDYGGCRFRDACRSGSAWEIENWLKNYTIESHWDFTNPEEEVAEV